MAARRSGGEGKDEAPDELRAMGVSEDEIERVLGSEAEAEFGVFPENVETVEMFLSLQTQWRTGPMGGCLGLEYPGVKAALDLRVRSRRRRAELFDALQAMERAALLVLNAK